MGVIKTTGHFTPMKSASIFPPTYARNYGHAKRRRAAVCSQVRQVRLIGQGFCGISFTLDFYKK